MDLARTVYGLTALGLCLLGGAPYRPAKTAKARLTSASMTVYAAHVAPRARKATGLAADAPTFERDVRPLLTHSCIECHSGPSPTGDLDLSAFTSDETARADPETWEKVAARLRDGEMPPEEKPRPDVAEVDAFARWFDSAVAVDCSKERDPGRVTVRRLNRVEYNDVTRDLFGMEFPQPRGVTDDEAKSGPAAQFPVDDSGFGFDDVGDVLSLSDVLLEKYMTASEQIVDAVWANPGALDRLRSAPRDPRHPDDGDTARVLRAFAGRAFRRPPTEDEIARLAALAKANDDGADAGLKTALRAILVSPAFLFRLEDDGDSENASAVTDYELASRLASFLWSSMPDERLFTLAAAGTLHEPEVLDDQVHRMLADPKAIALTTTFVLEWLEARAFGLPNLQHKLSLKQSMIEETVLYASHIVSENRSILEFLDSDYTYMNEELARLYYHVPGVTGDAFRKVKLPDSRYGGVLTQGLFLTVTSHPLQTSPVRRGRFLLENVLGATVPPPPAGVPALGGDDGAASAIDVPLRLLMESHRVNAQCATCHQRMDPLGFGLENFGTDGSWREYDGMLPVDAAGVLPDGESFDGPAQLRQTLLAHRDDFARVFTEKMFTFALGRGLTRDDRCAIDEIAAGLAKDGYRFQSLVMGIAKSEPFLKRRGRKVSLP